MHEQPLPKRWKGGSPVALSLDELESMDMALHDAIAVGKRESCLNRSFVSFDPVRKANEFRDLTKADLLSPCFQLLAPTLTYHFEKCLSQTISYFQRRVNKLQKRELFLFSGRQFLWGAQVQPDSLFGLTLVKWVWRRSCLFFVTLVVACDLKAAPHLFEEVVSAPDSDELHEQNLCIPFLEVLDRGLLPVVLLLPIGYEGRRHTYQEDCGVSAVLWFPLFRPTAGEQCGPRGRCVEQSHRMRVLALEA